MIKSIKFTEGYPLDIQLERWDTGEKYYTLRDKTIKFSDGLNVLMADNGYGKSTILKALSIYGLTNGGWSNLDFHYANFNDERNVDELANNNYHFKAKVDFDGPVFLIEKVREEHYNDSREHGGFGAGMFSSTEALIKRMYHKQRSSGEINMNEIGGLIMDLIEGETEFDKNEFLNSREFYNDIGEEIKKNLLNHANETILKGGKPTIILDEPDSNLSLQHKVGLFSSLLPKLAEKYQVIVATHHSLIPFYGGYNFVKIGFQEEGLKQYIKRIVNGNNKGECETN
jgi:predicted ATPase